MMIDQLLYKHLGADPTAAGVAWAVIFWRKTGPNVWSGNGVECASGNRYEPAGVVEDLQRRRTT
jgi:hypothetical protein